MDNTRFRINISFGFSMFFSFIWMIYDLIAFKIKLTDFTILFIVCILISLPLLLYSLFFIKNSYKVVSTEVNTYIEYYFIIHVISVLISVILSNFQNVYIYVISIFSKYVAIVCTYYVSKTIMKKTIELEDVYDNIKLSLAFQDAVVFGVSSIILYSIILGIVFFAGKSMVTLFIVTPIFILIAFSNYIKFKIIKPYMVIDKVRVIIIDNIAIIIAIIAAVFFSDSTMFDKSAIDKHVNINFIGLILSSLFIIPVIKTNKKIDAERKNI